MSFKSGCTAIALFTYSLLKKMKKTGIIGEDTLFSERMKIE